MADFYAARRGLIPPLPWPTFSPPFAVWRNDDDGRAILLYITEAEGRIARKAGFVRGFGTLASGAASLLDNG